MKDKLLRALIGLDIWLAELVHVVSDHRIGDCHELMQRRIDNEN